MSSIDSLLLDPAPLDIWIAYREDGQKGSGTQNDPFNGSTRAAFDSVTSNLPFDRSVRIHLGPSSAEKPFRTSGFRLDASANPGENAWLLRPAMSIIGSGVDVTFVQLAPASFVAGSHYFAIGCATTTCLDCFEIAHLTVDCNLPADQSVACGAIRVMGNHVRIRDVKCVRWGSRTSLQTAFGIAIVVTDPDENSPWLTVDNAGIENCAAVQPSEHISADAVIYALYVGGRERPQNGVVHFGRAPFIRNSFIDGAPNGGGTPDLTLEIRGLGVTGCHGGVAERNLVQNVKAGGPRQDRVNCRDLTVRYNTYINVVLGVSCPSVIRSPNLLPTGTTENLEHDVDYDDATIYVPRNAVHLFSEAREPSMLDSVLYDDVHILSSESAYNDRRFSVRFAGTFALPGPLTVAAISIVVPAVAPAAATVTSIQRYLSYENLIVEGNHFELADAAGAAGVKVADSGMIPFRPRHGRVVVRNNRFFTVIQSLDPPAFCGIDISGARAAIIMDNVVDTTAPNDATIVATECAAVRFSGNSTFDGDLLNAEVDAVQQQLHLPAEGALVVGMF